MQEALQSNPEAAAKLAQMQEAMQNPAMQNEMQQMMAAMSNPSFMAKMQELKEDPELKPVFEEMKAGGMAALMKYMNDPAFLAKIGEKMGDVVPGGAAAAAAGAPPAEEEAEVNNILDAVRYNDLEALEDFIAIGKGGLTDPEGRTALHYAAAYDRQQAVEVLLEHKADIEARDVKQNVPLHYAAGYGKGEIAHALVRAGADVRAQNEKGQTAAAIIRAEPRNPLNQDTELLAMLEA